MKVPNLCNLYFSQKVLTSLFISAAWSINCRANGMGGGISLLLFNPNGAIVFSFFIQYCSLCKRAMISTLSRRPMNVSGIFLYTCSSGVIIRKSIFGQISLKCFATGPDFFVLMYDLFSKIAHVIFCQFLQHTWLCSLNILQHILLLLIGS